MDTNLEALLWRLRLVEEAKETLVLTTFDFWDESGGQDMMAALWNAANRYTEGGLLTQEEEVQ